MERQRLEEYKKKNPNELTEKQLKKIKSEMESPKGNTISDEYFDFRLWCLGYPSRQESFAEYVAKRLERKKAKKVLEVGCGRTYRLSRILEKKGFEMTCIDPKVENLATYESNIVVKKEMFDFKYALDNYDCIVAQEPCDATEHIVRACEEQDKPFIMTLCGVPHTLISGEEPENVYEWYAYLLNISKENKIRLRYVSLDPLLETPILLKD